MTGTPGDEVIVGSPGGDVVNGNGGNDLVCGLSRQDPATTSSTAGRTPTPATARWARPTSRRGASRAPAFRSGRRGVPLYRTLPVAVG
ncbi:hypothetical protein ACFCZ1_35570 [Streptomyces sp. NPDC056224]|uniref:hypothetical protein n=1 Tax=Streptomyces sp. NPDC056224 TaxID=3345750 RepID=UPI0035DB813C